MPPSGIDVDRQDEGGYTAIMQAASSGHTEVVRVLLAVPGIDLNMADEDCGWSALMRASWQGHTEVVRVFVAQRGINVNRGDKDYGWTAVMRAAARGYIGVVRVLLDVPGVDLEKRACGGPDMGKTALGLALHFEEEYYDAERKARKAEVAALLRAAGAEE